MVSRLPPLPNGGAFPVGAGNGAGTMSHFMGGRGGGTILILTHSLPLVLTFSILGSLQELPTHSTVLAEEKTASIIETEVL